MLRSVYGRNERIEWMEMKKLHLGVKEFLKGFNAPEPPARFFSDVGQAKSG